MIIQVTAVCSGHGPFVVEFFNVLCECFRLPTTGLTPESLISNADTTMSVIEAVQFLLERGLPRQGGSPLTLGRLHLNNVDTTSNMSYG